ncbi:MAG: hypothetical protein JO247_08175 [Chloroflexi bacterium]|nr:hypothetical protein [Chloroflexota bacterium]
MRLPVLRARGVAAKRAQSVTEASALHAVVLVPLPRQRPRPRVELVLLPLLLIALAVALALNYRIVAEQSPTAAATAVSSAARAVPAAAFDVCYSNPSWTPPPPDVEGAHLQADPRYRGVDLTTTALAHERVYVESGAFRSASSFGDFMALSGLWSDPGLQNIPCSDDLRTTAELWGLALHFDRAQFDGPDLTVYASPQPSGVEAIHIPLPPAAEALHVLDASGTKIIPDTHLGNQ